MHSSFGHASRIVCILYYVLEQKKVNDTIIYYTVFNSVLKIIYFAFLF